MRHAGIVALLLAALVLAGGLFVQLGVYNVAADAPHTRPVFAMLEAVRDRSIAVRATSVVVPVDLDTAARVRSGAGLYGEMCQGCHLGPGVAATELAQGLYPQAPLLARAGDLSPAEQFWIIKHGVKLSAMPAWGRTHPDQLIWNMVAFLRQLPRLSAAQYHAMTADAPDEHASEMQAADSDHQQVGHDHAQ